jgi:hypothetical protein
MANNNCNATTLQETSDTPTTEINPQDAMISTIEQIDKARCMHDILLACMMYELTSDGKLHPLCREVVIFIRNLMVRWHCPRQQVAELPLETQQAFEKVLAEPHSGAQKASREGALYLILTALTLDDHFRQLMLGNMVDSDIDKVNPRLTVLIHENNIVNGGNYFYNQEKLHKFLATGYLQRQMEQSQNFPNLVTPREFLYSCLVAYFTT